MATCPTFQAVADEGNTVIESDTVQHQENQKTKFLRVATILLRLVKW